MIAAVILAAGAGRRMGGPKALLVFQGESLLQRAVGLALEAGCQPVITVVGAWDPGPVNPRAFIVQNPVPAEGMASSIRTGIQAVPLESDAALLMTVDQPGVDVTLLRGLMDLASADPSRPVACSYADTVGVPAVLPRHLFPELLALQGDQGAKALLLREGAATLPFPQGADDLDTPADRDRFTR